MLRPSVFVAAFLALAVVISSSATAQAQGTEHDGTPLAPLDTASPRSTYDSFKIQADRFADAFVEYRSNKSTAGLLELYDVLQKGGTLFDLSEIAAANRSEVSAASVIYLIDILNRLPEPPPGALPGIDDIDPDAPPTEVYLPDTEIALRRIAEGPGTGAYLFSADTVARLPEFHARIVDEPVVRPSEYPSWREQQVRFAGPLIPAAFVDAIPEPLRVNILGTPAWKVVATLVLTGLVLGAVRGAARIVCLGVADRSPTLAYGARLALPALLAALLYGAAFLIRFQINPSGAFAQYTAAVFVFGFFLTAAWAIWLACQFIVELVISSPSIPDESYDAHLLRLLARIVGILGVAALIVYGANAIGLPLLGLIAGIGVGGVALALAAQSTVENLFGGITVLADRPFRVGDFIQFAGGMGTVEGVGPRSSRIRGVDGAQTTVPNADLAKMLVTNYSNRSKCLFSHVLGLRYETTPEQIEWLIAELESRIAAHPLVEVEPGMPRVRLVAFGAFSIDLEARAYVTTGDFGRFLEVQQELMLTIMRTLDEAGTGFAFPSQTAYLARDMAPDPSRIDGKRPSARERRDDGKAADGLSGPRRFGSKGVAT